MKPISVNTSMLLGPAKSQILYEPLGSVLILGAWNFPIFTTIGPLVTAICSGNCAVIKPSELSPNTSRAMTQLIEKYLDSGCYISIQGGVEVAKAVT